MRWDGTNMPLIERGDDFGPCAEYLAARYSGEFAAYPYIDADAVEAAAIARFMPMAASFTTPEGKRAYLTPKLHLERCVLDPGKARVTRTARSQAARYSLSVNHAFGSALAACVDVHGPDWLIPELVDAFASLHAQRQSRVSAFISFELWMPRGNSMELVAGEIGYVIGRAYASLTGFSRVSGAGTVQLAATGAFLAGAGVSVWDLGMPMPYKLALGGHALTRDRYLPGLAAAYGEEASLARASLVPMSGLVAAKDVIDGRSRLGQTMLA